MKYKYDNWQPTASLPPPSPWCDFLLPQYIETEAAADEEVVAIIGYIHSFNVAPLVIYAEYGTLQPLYPDLGAVDDNEDEDVIRLWRT